RLARASVAHIPLAATLPNVIGGTAVRTTLGDARRLLGAGELGAGAGGTPVWLVQLTGRFECSTCSRPAGFDRPVGGVLSLVLDADLSGELGIALADAAVDLSGVGEVVAFPLP
ncbi:MAG: hypothetical protein AAGC63_08005, partial [Propionicimonas sp.]|nr:hypothetical protein [Propionicimonas sp.]